MSLQLDEEEALDVLRSFLQNSLIANFYTGNTDLSSAMGSVFGASFEYRDFSNLRMGQVVRMAEIEISARGAGENSLHASPGLAGEQDSRGTFDTSTLTMTLFDSSDESTFIHEAGHFYLEVLSGLSAKAVDTPTMQTITRQKSLPGAGSGNCWLARVSKKRRKRAGSQDKR